MPPANDQTGGSRSVQKTSLAKLAKSFAKKNAEKRAKDSWSNLIKNALILQRGKIPLLLAVEAGNQSMVRELLSAQTADQLKVSIFLSFYYFRTKTKTNKYSKTN